MVGGDGGGECVIGCLGDARGTTRRARRVVMWLLNGDGDGEKEMVDVMVSVVGGVLMMRVVVEEVDELNVTNAFVVVGVGAFLRFGIGCLVVLDLLVWDLLSIFVSMVMGLVLKLMLIGVWVFGVLTVALATKTFTFT